MTMMVTIVTRQSLSADTFSSVPKSSDDGHDRTRSAIYYNTLYDNL